jgi:hypothetical protein
MKHMVGGNGWKPAAQPQGRALSQIKIDRSLLGLI